MTRSPGYLSSGTVSSMGRTSHPAAPTAAAAGPSTATATAAAAAAAAATRLPPKRVIYRSSNLMRTAPDLGATTFDSEYIREAHRMAEEVREQFRQQKVGREELPAVTGSGVSADAQRHQRRVKMNRDSAAISRVRREAYVSALELQLVKLERDYKRLQSEVETVQSSPAHDLASQTHSLQQEVALASDFTQHLSPRHVPVIEVGQHPDCRFPAHSSVFAPAAPPDLQESNSSEEDSCAGGILSQSVDAAPVPSSDLDDGGASLWPEMDLSNIRTIDNLPTQSATPVQTLSTDGGFAELVPELAQIEPDFFVKLVQDHDATRVSADQCDATDELLSLYSYLPE